MSGFRQAVSRLRYEAARESYLQDLAQAERRYWAALDEDEPTSGDWARLGAFVLGITIAVLWVLG